MNRFFVILLILASFSLHAQTYWQQKVDTKIIVALDDQNNILRAYEEFTYYNNSPDTLKFIYIHLWANAYKNDHTPFAKQLDQNRNTNFYYSKPEEKGEIDSLQFSVDNISIDHYSNNATPDIARIDLPQPLMPGSKIKVATPFRLNLPKVFSRLGHNGQAYYISQWYPKPAVYDSKGWHPISYLDQGEFFSEYGSYDVTITLPRNYILMATGNCITDSENKWMDSLAKLTRPSVTVLNEPYPLSETTTKTITYHEDNIHDFAWFADKRWVVRKDTVYSPGNDHPIAVWNAYLPFYERQWSKADSYLKEAVRHYGKWVGAYPYHTIKAVQGDLKAGGGMEYPTITLIDKTATASLQTVVVHEAGHNWFYGMIGSNERDHAWMDEGINTFYEEKTVDEMNMGGGRNWQSILNEKLLYTAYFSKATTHEDQSIDQTSANFTKFNYGMDVYYKTAMMLRWLEKYMGDSNYEKGMKDYFQKWQYKHPYPNDFKACMQRQTSKNIDWFFDELLTTDKKIDYKIDDATIRDKSTSIIIHNNTGVMAPVLIDAYKNDSIVASVWTKPFNGNDTINIPISEWDKLKINKVIPDAKTTNNTYRRRAMSHDFGILLKPFLGLNRADYDKVFIAPSAGYNQYDGMMAGLLIHDLALPENRFRFAIAPMYSFLTKSIVGAGSVGYIWYPTGIFREMMLQTDMKSFHDNETLIHLSEPKYSNYTKIAPSLNFTFNQHDPLSTLVRTLTLKAYSITEQNFYFADSISKPTLASQQKSYGLLRYTHTNDRTYNPFSYSAEAQMGADYAKIMAEGNIRIDYNKKNKALYVRAFLGKFFAINSDPAIASRYYLNASYSGLDDYLYDGTYLGRNALKNLDAQQLSMQEGGFKIPVFNNADRSNNWMATMNLSTDLPLKKLDVKLFFDAGLIPNPNPTFTNMSSTTLLYDGGIEFISGKFIHIYIPLIMSNDFQNYLSNTYGHKNVFARSLSFTLKLQNINWLKTPEQIVKKIENSQN